MISSDFYLVEFHSHTSASKDSLTPPQKLINEARRKGLGRIVITDHNSIAGAKLARELDPELVIVGEEIMTTKGEILAAFVREQIPAGLPPIDVINLLKAQGAFISVSHPYDSMRAGGWKEPDLLDILPYIDAIEVFNSRCMRNSFNHLAQLFAEKYNIPGTVGSDAHAAFEVGRSVLKLKPFNGPDELRQVIRSGEPITKASPNWFHLTSRYATVTKKLQSRS
jgi:predicted metal-dependent phosphoesterase TrpH